MSKTSSGSKIWRVCIKQTKVCMWLCHWKGIISEFAFKSRLIMHVGTYKIQCPFDLVRQLMEYSSRLSSQHFTLYFNSFFSVCALSLPLGWVQVHLSLESELRSYGRPSVTLSSCIFNLEACLRHSDFNLCLHVIPQSRGCVGIVP